MKKVSFAVILVRPRNPLNIGAAARAMANFGLGDLRIVSPYPPVWNESLQTHPFTFECVPIPLPKCLREQHLTRKGV